MRQPVELDPQGPLTENLRWFHNKCHSEIIKNSEKKYKQQLKQNVLKIVNKANKSFYEKIDAWHYFRPHQEIFGSFFKAVIRLALSDDDEFDLNITNRHELLTFFNYTFNSIEVDFVREQIRKYLPLSIWINLSHSCRDIELSKLSKRIRIAWKKLEEQDERLDKSVLEERMFERKFMFLYLKKFFQILQSVVIHSTGGVGDDEHDDDDDDDNGNGNDNVNTIDELNKNAALYCQRFVEFIIDIESQLPLRRFFHAILKYTHFTVRCQISRLASHKSPEGHLFVQLVELLLLYSRYEIDIMTGDPLTDVEVLRKHERDIMSLQKLLWSTYDHLKHYAIKPIKAIDNPSTLYKIITSFDSKEELLEFVKAVGLVDEECMEEGDKENVCLLASIVMSFYKRYDSQMKKINSIPLFPNESVIWDTNLVPDQYYNYESPLALPKLNLQFLTMSDYLLRNFMLFKNESTYEIRQDLEDGIIRSKCRWTAEGQFATGPKQRMALIIKDFSITEVGKPRLGENCPSKVRAKVVINMDYVRPEWCREWEQLRKHDTCFLVSFKKPTDKDHLGWPDGTFPARNNIKYVRGCEIEALFDSDGKVVDENLEKPNFKNNIRTFMVWLDCNQYKIDQDAFKERKLTVYDKFHLMVRRKPEKNNFKGVLETIRHLINTKFVVPDWLRNLLIGFGDPADAHHSNLRDSNEELELDYFDTFINYDHLVDSMRVIKADFQVALSEDVQKRKLSKEPPFKLRFNEENKIITVIPYRIPSRGPYPTVLPKKNLIKFTSAQVESITSGLQAGLTMVVGPPGTGKTDVAVQILSTLYHSYPEQRTLIVTHSNQALNQIFEKMIELDVSEHHLLRLGHGEEELQSNKDFSKRGRIRYVLSRRLELLAQVGRLARSLDLDPGQGFTCESAEYFNFYHIISRWDEYVQSIKGTKNIDDISNKFPFTKFFDDAPQPLFQRKSISEDFEISKGCYRYIKQMFDDLQSFRPFEIFSSGSDRSKYLLIREAKVIAMTCTHAGLRRKELVEMNFQYDNILMEETAQILEIETTIPLLLQNPENGVNRLKRWIMIGDHNQLPPIIQNSAFQKFSNMEQSLFARFIRLGVPAIELDAQGRARPSICDLYRWRYKNLTELDHVKMGVEFMIANAGFVHEYQLINVEDYKGVGESTPMPYYYQNKGEAEYVIAVYKYMRILGYPNEKITILTTYNGQKQLLRDMIESECTRDAYIGKPDKVTTVDKFQGQQNDFILLSLVRTRTVGHVRDIRRLVVAMSRARLGLYVFARVNLFSSCYELQHSMKHFLSRSQKLCLTKFNERYPTERPIDQQITDFEVKEIASLESMQQLVEQNYSCFIEEQTRVARQLDDDLVMQEEPESHKGD